MLHSVFFLLILLVAVLSGTRNHHRIDLSQQLYDRMRSIFSENKIELTSASVLLSNTYSYVGDYQQAENIRTNRIEQFGNKIKPGISWTEVNGEILVSRILLISNHNVCC